MSEIEKFIQTQRNENQFVCHNILYKCLPRVMVREIILQDKNFLNFTGIKDNVTDGLSARNIIDNLPHINYNDLKFEFIP